MPGTGLGLAIVRTLARRWDGDARLADRPDGGARAELTLPLAVRAAGGHAGQRGDGRLSLRVVLLGLAGLAAAALLGFAGYLVGRDTIALPATSLSAGDGRLDRPHGAAGLDHAARRRRRPDDDRRKGDATATTTVATTTDEATAAARAWARTGRRRAAPDGVAAGGDDD